MVVEHPRTYNSFFFIENRLYYKHSHFRAGVAGKELYKYI